VRSDARRAGLFSFPIGAILNGVPIVTTKTPDIESPAPPAAQREFAEKAAAMKAASGKRTGERPHAKQVGIAREQAAASLPALRHLQLLTRQEVMSLSGLSYPTIWAWGRKGKFPKPKVVGGKNMWLASEIDAWVNSLVTREWKPLDDESAS
jgi:predicted DNA-binding transcriptional regulator AlpA